MIETGRIVVATVRAPLLDPNLPDKPRPCVIVDTRPDRRGFIGVMGLTTNETFADGTPRVPYPLAARSGLRRSGFFWSDDLTWISPHEITKHLGMVTPDLARAIVAYAKLDEHCAVALLMAAQ